MENLPVVNNPESSFSKNNKKNIIFVFVPVVFLFFIYFLFISAPISFPTGVVVKIEPGMSLRSVSLKLSDGHFIRSRVIFEALVILFGREKRVISGDYFFEKKLSVFKIALRISKGKHFMAPVSVTIPEGFNIKQIGEIFAGELINFNKTEFEAKAKELEGYLFPDTYFFLTTDDEDRVIDSMNKNFEKKITPLLPEIKSSGKTKENIIIMASLVEGEAKGDDDREIISGILWKRISINMPLQVDVAPGTYKTKGLPEKPIGNPGLKAIGAAINPKSSPYLYYLHDQNGNIHYAKNFAEHLKNKSRYLK